MRVLKVLRVLKFDKPYGLEGCGGAQRSRFAAQVQRVQKVQRVVVAPFGRSFERPLRGLKPLKPGFARKGGCEGFPALPP